VTIMPDEPKSSRLEESLNGSPDQDPCGSAGGVPLPPGDPPDDVPTDPPDEIPPRPPDGVPPGPPIEIPPDLPGDVPPGPPDVEPIPLPLNVR